MSVEMHDHYRNLEAEDREPPESVPFVAPEMRVAPATQTSRSITAAMNNVAAGQPLGVIHHLAVAQQYAVAWAETIDPDPEVSDADSPF